MLKGRICPYCHIKTEYKNSVDIYGADYGMIYICPKCRAYVGVHKGTDKAKGRLANEYLRRCKIEGKDEPPDVTDTPGGSVRSNRERYLVMRYCKGRLKIRLSNAPRKNDFRNKDIFLGNR